jgi:hypothetical protein
MKTTVEDDKRTVVETGPWQVTVRINQAGNLTIEVELNGHLHADLILQEGGTLDLGTFATPWPLGEKGWDMPGAPSKSMRKFRFGPGDQPPAA